MKWFNSFKKEGTSYISLVSVTLIFLIAGIFHYIFYNTEMEYNENRVIEIQNTRKELCWKVIETAIYNAVYDAKLDATKAAEVIVYDIENNFDREVLKQKLDTTSIAETELVGLIYSDIKGKYLYDINSTKNTLLVVSNHGFVISTETLNKDRIANPLFDEIDKAYNIKLTEKSFQLILTHQLPQGFVFCETESHTNPDHIKINIPSLNDMKEVYMKEGLSGLSGYVFLVPVYITNDGDIFGTPDVSNDGTINRNHKLIVIQSFGVTNILRQHNLAELKEIEKSTIKLEEEIKHGMVLRTLSYIAIMLLNIFALLMMLYFIHYIKNK